MNTEELKAEMKAIVNEQALINTRIDRVVELSFQNGNCFKDLQNDPDAVLFQMLAVAMMLYRRSANWNVPLPFLQSIIDSLPAMVQSWYMGEALRSRVNGDDESIPEQQQATDVDEWDDVIG